MSHQHRQHAEIRRARQARLGAIHAGLSVIALLVVMAVYWWHDGQARAEKAVHDAGQQTYLLERERDRLWLSRIADAYAQGRKDVLDAVKGSPEAGQVLMACARLKEPRP